MQNLNYKHLHYFWVVAKSGGVAKAGEQLHVTPQSISGQIRMLEESIGAPLWRRSGRKLELTETGHMVMDFADRLFTVGEQLKDALRDSQMGAVTTFRVGVAGSVVKVLAHKLIAPALEVPQPPRLECREGRFAELLGLLAVHKLDLVLSDRQMNSSMNVRGYNHLLEESGVSFWPSKAWPPLCAANFHTACTKCPCSCQVKTRPFVCVCCVGSMPWKFVRASWGISMTRP